MPDEFDSDVPMPFRPRAPKAYRRKGRLLANPLFQPPWYWSLLFEMVFVANQYSQNRLIILHKLPPVKAGSVTLQMTQLAR